MSRQDLRAGDVLIGPYTGERYKVVKNTGGVVTIKSESGPEEHWSEDGLKRDGYRKDGE